jgi:hypothetical protein
MVPQPKLFQQVDYKNKENNHEIYSGYESW